MFCNSQQSNSMRRNAFGDQVPFFQREAMLSLAWGAVLIFSAGLCFADAPNKDVLNQDASNKAGEPGGSGEDSFERPALQLIPTPLRQPGENSSERPAADTVENHAQAHFNWITDLEEARKIARAENKDLLLFFTGSDWCGFCIKLEKAVLNTPDFAEWISDKYVPVLLDFPRNQEKFSEALKEQNAKLKDAQEIRGFPTIVTVDTEILPYGRIVGFNDPIPFWSNLKKAFTQAGKIREARGGVVVSEITQPEVLDRVLSAVPEGQLRYGWLPHVNRLIESSDTKNPELKEKWSRTLAATRQAIADQELVTVAARGYQQKRRDRAAASEILEFLDAGLAESPDSPALQRYYLTTKARYLREQKDDEKSLEVVDKILSSSWVNAEDRSTVSSLRWQALLRLGRIDEGVALIRETLAEWDYPSEKEKEAAIQSTIATELSNAGHSPKTAPVDTADRVSLNWFTNLEKAQEAARAQKKDLLLLFTGSDWCAPCRQLKKQILDTREFAERINDKYVLLELDFPNGTELPQEQVEQNRKLSGQLNNSGYPSIYFADAEILPYGKIVGFGGSETFYNRLDRSLERAAQYRQATQGGFVSAVTSAGTLDQVLSIVPEELIPSGWTPHLERLIAASSAEHPELHAKWSKARDRVQESIAHQERGRRFSKNIATLQEKKGAGASLDDVFAFLDASIEEAQGHPEQIHFFLISKAQTLQEHQEYEKALGNVEELLSATQGRNRESLVSLQQQLLLNLGRFDEGIELVVASLANRKFPSEEARQSFTNSLIARQLTQAGQYTESLKYWQTTNLEEAQDQVRAEGSGRTARLIRLGGPAQPQSTSEQSLQNQPVFASIDFATQSTGRDHELRGRSLLAWSGAGQRGERRQSQKERAALAAVSFRAADRFDLVEQAIAALNLTDEATDTEQATQESLQETLGIAKGSQGDALRYLAGKSTSTVGQGVYLLEAAFAFAREGRTAEAKELAQQAADLDKQIDSKLPDQAGVEYFRKLLGRWSAENKTASRS